MSRLLEIESCWDCPFFKYDCYTDKHECMRFKFHLYDVYKWELFLDDKNYFQETYVYCKLPEKE